MAVKAFHAFKKVKVNPQEIQELVTVSVLEGVEMKRLLICNLWSNKLIKKEQKIVEALLILFNRQSKLVNFCRILGA